MPTIRDVAGKSLYTIDWSSKQALVFNADKTWQTLQVVNWWYLYLVLKLNYDLERNFSLPENEFVEKPEIWVFIVGCPISQDYKGV